MAVTVDLHPKHTSFVSPENVDVAVSIPLPGGPPRQRRDFDDVRQLVKLQWVAVAGEYTALMLDLRQARNDDAHIYLTHGSNGYGEYVCRIMPGTVKMTSASGEVYYVEATVEVRGLAP